MFGQSVVVAALLVDNLTPPFNNFTSLSLINGVFEPLDDLLIVKVIPLIIALAGIEKP